MRARRPGENAADYLNDMADAGLLRFRVNGIELAATREIVFPDRPKKKAKPKRKRAMTANPGRIPLDNARALTSGDIARWSISEAHDGPEVLVFQMELTVRLRQALCSLPIKQLELILARFFDELTLEETAKKLGHCGRERVRQIESSAIMSIRRAIGENPFDGERQRRHRRSPVVGRAVALSLPGPSNAREPSRVQLWGGGPRMTIAEVRPNGPEYEVECVWLDEGGNPHSGCFRDSQLVFVQ